MTPVHWHLLLNHVPVLATPFGLAVLVWGLLFRSSDVKRLSLVVFIVSALIAWPAHSTGENSSLEVEDSSDATQAFISVHEHAAHIAFYSLLALGVISLAALILWRGPKKMPAWFTIVILLSSATVSAMMAGTAYLGGQIRHTEIRTKASEANALKKAKEIEE